MEKVKMTLRILVWIPIFLLIACEEKVLFDFDEQLAMDLTEIDDFLARNNIVTETLYSHARLNIVEEGNGRIPQDLDTVRYLFSIYDLDSTLLMSNRQEFSTISNQIWFVPDTLDFIAYPGWLDQTLSTFYTLATSLSEEGSVIQLFMPSYLMSNAVAVPRNKPVMMDFEVVEILR